MADRVDREKFTECSLHQYVVAILEKAEPVEGSARKTKAELSVLAKQLLTSVRQKTSEGITDSPYFFQAYAEARKLLHLTTELKDLDLDGILEHPTLRGMMVTTIRNLEKEARSAAR